MFNSALEWLARSVADRHDEYADGVRQRLADAGLPLDTAVALLTKYIERTEAHNTAGLMRRALTEGLSAQ